MLTSLFEYIDPLRKEKINSSDKIPNVDYIELSDFIKLGDKSNLKLESIPYVKNKPAIITYTSGTTSFPKGVVHTNDSVNNMISIYEEGKGFGAITGDRNLILIPPSYLTSLIHSIIGPMSLGTTNILQPIYNPKTFGQDLEKYKPVIAIASKAHYISLSSCGLERNSLSATKFPYCGGEALSRATVSKINKIHEYLGMPPIIIGYGMTELGTMAMFSNKLLNRNNEAGILIPNVNAKIIDSLTGKEVKKGKTGELIIQSPSMMLGYYNNQVATDEKIITTNNGKWMKTGDIARVKYQQESNDVYDVMGRSTDSFIDENGNTVYLFDIENKVEEIKYVEQAEVVALTVDGKTFPVVHVVLDKNGKEVPEDIINLIDATLKSSLKNQNAIPYAYKIRDSFDISPISGKRDYEILKSETDGYLKIETDGGILPINIYS